MAPLTTGHVGIGDTLFATRCNMSTSGWTTWPSIHPPLWLLLNAIVRTIIEVRQLAKYLGLEDPTCTLLLEHPSKTSSSSTYSRL